MHEVYVGIGSNLRRERNIKAALQALREKFGRLRQSRVYQSPATDDCGDDYYNLVVAFVTELEIAELKSTLQNIEQQLHRDRSARGCVSIDLDVLLYGDCVGEFGSVSLPHRDIDTRLHVIQPLAELSPLGVHPQTGENFQQILAKHSRCLQPIELS